MTSKRIVVAGAGIAGLTAAYSLNRHGHRPIVLERSDRVGGRMTTDVLNGFTIDCGAQFLSTGYSILTELIREAGLNPAVVEISPYGGTVRDGRIRKRREHDLLSPLKTGLLSPGGWARLGFLGYRLSVATKSLPWNDLTAWAAYDDVDAETWSQSYFGREITDYIAEPMIDGLAFQSLGEVSGALLVAWVSHFVFGKSKLISLTGGIGVLPERLAAGLDIRFDSPVQSLAIGKAGVEVGTGSDVIAADGVILATPASAARAVYKEPSTIERELLGTQYSSTLQIAVAVRDSFRIDPGIAEIYGFLVPKRERSAISAITIEESKDKRRLGDGQLFCVFLSGEAGARMIGWTDEAVLSGVLNELEKYLPGVTGDVLFTKIYRWKDAIAMVPPGRSRRVAQYRNSVDASAQVLLAGDYTGMPWTEGAAETGRWAAQRLMRNLA